MKTLIVISLTISTLVASADQADLVRLYEEEVLAHDLYVELGKIHPEIMPFQNIPQSEARHQEVMSGILKKEKVAMPKPREGKRFVTKGLDRIYRKWLAEGKKSAADACRVGVRLEEFDIVDLQEAQAEFPAHKESLAALESASNNHLRAFYRNLTSRDGEYVPTKLKKDEFEEIVSSSNSRCGCGDGCCSGKGQGRAEGMGPGKGQGNVQGRGNGPGPGKGRRQNGQGGPGRGR